MLDLQKPCAIGFPGGTYAPQLATRTSTENADGPVISYYRQSAAGKIQGCVSGVCRKLQ